MKQTKNTLKELPMADRPRERLLQHGPEALSSIELIAVLLGSGTKGKSVLVLSQELLSHFGSLESILHANVEELCSIKGLGKVKAIQLKAAFGLACRARREQFALNEQLDSPCKAYLWVRDYVEHEPKEVFGVILLDARMAPLRWERVSVGILDETLVHPREIFHPAIRYRAASIILVHNHPSGDPTPSLEDRHLTRNLTKVSHSMGIPIIDHLIVGKKSYTSLKEEGFAFAQVKPSPK